MFTGQTLKLESCRRCAGAGVEPKSESHCPACGGGGFQPIVFDLGATRTYTKGRPAVWNPGRGELTVTRGKTRTDYRVSEVPTDRVHGEPTTRGFACVKSDRYGHAVETHHVEVSERAGYSRCDCVGFLSEASKRASTSGWAGTFGCLHLDAVLKLVWDELIPELKLEVV